MEDHPHATDDALGQTDEQLLVFTISDEAMETAAGGNLGADLSQYVRRDDVYQ